MTSHLQRVARLLLEHRQKPERFWHWIFPGKPVSLADANKFMLGAILDYQIPAATAWDNGRRLAEEICGDPATVWAWMTSFPLPQWNSKWREFRLHRFPKAHERIWRIGRQILDRYGGDPRTIWEGRSPGEVLDLLHEIRTGEQISRMIVGALIDTGKISGKTDVKVDTHVRQVLGRSIRGKVFDLDEEAAVLELTREMSPENPWLLDEQLYLLGKSICTAPTPDCRRCYLSVECIFGETRPISYCGKRNNTSSQKPQKRCNSETFLPKVEDFMPGTATKTGEVRKEFWESFLRVVNRTTDLFGSTIPTRNDWIGTTAGQPGLYYACKVAANDTKVMLNIARNKFGDQKEILNRLKEHQREVEAAFGGPLEWVQGERGPICRIMKVLSGGGYSNRGNWEAISHSTIEAILRLKTALDPYVRYLQI